MARVGSDAWFGEIEEWLRELLAQLPQGPEGARSELIALIREIERVRVVNGRLRILQPADGPI
jgi:hypothetical protein